MWSRNNGTGILVSKKYAVMHIEAEKYAYLL